MDEFEWEGEDDNSEDLEALFELEKGKLNPLLIVQYSSTNAGWLWHWIVAQKDNQFSKVQRKLDFSYAMEEDENDARGKNEIVIDYQLPKQYATSAKRRLEKDENEPPGNNEDKDAREGTVVQRFFDPT